MKNPAEIAAKIRQVRFEYLKMAYQSELTKRPHNCIYNRTATLYGEGEIVTRLCGFYSDDRNYIICDTDDGAQSCDAFVCKKSKKQIRKQVEKDMKENSQKYPEILALEWVLGHNQPVAFISRVQRFMTAIKKWIRSVRGFK
jgi:hypothetical protein